jgi:MFS family permease
MNMKLLNNRDFVLLILGQLVSFFGSKVQSFALSLYVLSVTNSTAQFASVLAISMLPNLVLGPFAGVLVDWWDRKKIVVWLDLISGVVVLLAALVYHLNGELSLNFIYCLSIIFSIIGLLFAPASNTLIPSIVPKDELIEANSISSMVFNIASFVTPLIAGLLYGMFGLMVIFLINGASFIISGISEMFIRIPKIDQRNKKMTPKQFAKDFIEGIMYVKQSKVIFSLLLLALALNFFYSPIMSIGIIHLCKQVFQVSDKTYGLMQSILVTASFITPVILPWISKRTTISRLLLFNLTCVSLQVGLIAFVTTDLFRVTLFNDQVAFIALTGIIFATIIFVSLGNMSLMTIMQKTIPLELMGRVGTFRSSMVMAIIPLGQLIFGFLFDHLPTWQCFMLSSVFMLVTIIAFRKPLLEYDQIEALEKTEAQLSEEVCS